MIITPRFVLEIWCRHWPKFVIGLLGYWSEQKNPKLPYRWLQEYDKDFPSVTKKISQLSASSILNLFRQDKSLWPFPDFRYVIIQLMYNLGGKQGRDKVAEVVMMSRKILGRDEQGKILEFLATDTVVELLEGFIPFERKQAISNSNEEAVAAWLTRWDARVKESQGDLQSPAVLADLSGEKAYRIKELMLKIDPRRFIRHEYYEIKHIE
jgi:hypothetical protein